MSIYNLTLLALENVGDSVKIISYGSGTNDDYTPASTTADRREILLSNMSTQSIYTSSSRHRYESRVSRRCKLPFIHSVLSKTTQTILSSILQALSYDTIAARPDKLH